MPLLAPVKQHHVGTPGVSRSFSHYSRTCLKKQKADGVERLSYSERVHPSLKGGRSLFQRGER